MRTSSLAISSPTIRFGTMGLLLILVVVWGINWPVIKLALYDMPPLWLGATRMLVGALCLFAYLAFTNQLRLPQLSTIPLLLTVGGVQFGLFIGLVNIGLVHVETGRSILLAYTTPLWVIPIAVLVFKEPINWKKLTGLGIGLLGILTLFNPFTFNWHSHLQLVSNGILLLAALLWGLVMIHVRFTKVAYNSLQLLPWQLLLAGLVLAALALPIEPHPVVHWNWHFGEMLFYIGVIGTAFGCWAAVEVNRKLPTVTASIGFLGVPVVGVFSSALIWDQLSFTLLISLILLISGIALATHRVNANKS